MYTNIQKLLHTIYIINRSFVYDQILNHNFIIKTHKKTNYNIVHLFH